MDDNVLIKIVNNDWQESIIALANMHKNLRGKKNDEYKKQEDKIKFLTILKENLENEQKKNKNNNSWLTIWKKIFIFISLLFLCASLIPFVLLFCLPPIGSLICTVIFGSLLATPCLIYGAVSAIIVFTTIIKNISKKIINFVKKCVKIKQTLTKQQYISLKQKYLSEVYERTRNHLKNDNKQPSNQFEAAAINSMRQPQPSTSRFKPTSPKI